ncbi:MAG: nuclear transport factor 2 family protein [Gammaproteobacteria bacterium]|nr:nuclear transport factor 2 family protein [Gammaproteobacteria bacterium]
MLLLVSLIASDVRGETPPTAIEVVDAFHQSLKNGNSESAVALLAEDLVVLEQGGIDRSKQAYVSGHLNADIDFARAVTRRVIERRSGGEDRVHWVLSRYRLTGSYRGARVDRSMVETMILSKVDGRWRISHIHWSERAR